MIIYEGTNNLVSGAFLKCFSIYHIMITSFFLKLFKNALKIQQDSILKFLSLFPHVMLISY